MIRAVQTTLEEEGDEQLRGVVEHKGIKVKEAVRETVATWTKESKPLETGDQFFKLEPADIGDPELSSKVNEVLYGRKKRG